MSMRVVLMGALMFAASAAMAQSVSSTVVASDRWSPLSAPAASAAIAAGSPTALPGGGDQASHFKFKQHRDYRPMRNAAQEQSGKAPVMGSGHIGADGRPAVVCAQTPMDPACR